MENRVPEDYNNRLQLQDDTGADSKMQDLRKKVRNLRILVCILLFLTSFQSVFLFFISKGRIPSSLVIIKEVIVKEDNNTNAVGFNDEKEQ